MSDVNKSFDVGTYAVFDNAKSINNSGADKFNQFASEMKSFGSQITEDVFAGPASEYFTEELPILEQGLTTYAVHLMGRLNRILDKFHKNYATADKQAENTVKNV